MARNGKLTDSFVKSAGGPKPGKPYAIHYDGEIKGFGLRVTKSGARSFVLNYRARGVERRLTIGSYPDWKAAAAREEAGRLKREIDRGRDPMAERHEERAAPTVNDLIERYLTDHASRKGERSRREDESLIAQWVKPALGNRKVADIRHGDIECLHREITAHGTPVRANRAATLLSKMFTLAVRWEMRADNPVRGIERNHEERRMRYLSGDELRRLTAALTAHRNQSVANAIRLLLLTGARRSEVLGATWDQFDLEAGLWTKPSSHTKQRREHRTPLNAPARQLLAEIRAAAERDAREHGHQPSPYVFPARGGSGPMVEIKYAWKSVCATAELSGVRPHDLRHHFASILASAGLSLPVIGALLGHSQPGTTSRYAHLFDDPLRAATERVGAVVMGDDKPAADVIEIGRH